MSRFETKTYYAAMEDRIINALAKTPVLTSEELRLAACDTQEVVWMRIRKLIAAGKIQKSKGVGGKQNRYRLHPEFRKSLETAGAS